MPTVKFVPREISVILDSNPANGAINRSADGSTFEVQFQDPLIIPKNAINPTLDVEESNIWYTQPNVFDSGVEQNNQFEFNAVLLSVPAGIYTVSSLESAMNRSIDENPITIGNTLSLIFNQSTGLLELTLNAGNTLLFPINNSLGALTGFDTNVLYTAVLNPNISQSVPTFNNINYYLVQCDLVNQGVRFNNLYRNIIEVSLIDVPPRDLIIHRPFHPPTIPIDFLAGNPRNKVRVSLLRDDLQPAETQGEYYFLRLSLRWLEPISFPL
jgi:hypothetical protein